MGATVSLQFQQALRNGDEITALQLYHSSPELKKLNVNKVYKLSQTRSTPLHYAAKRALRDIYGEFLLQGGDPTVRNGRYQTAIHLICTCTNVAKDPVKCERRATMLTLTIDYCNKKKQRIIGLMFVDSSLNSPLHLAATSGLVKCVEILVANDAFILGQKNIAGQTPLDCAQNAPNKAAIAAILEPLMVFASNEKSTAELAVKPPYLKQESYMSYHEDRLKLLREEIVSEVTRSLGLSAVHAESLLEANGWSAQIVIEKWIEDRMGLCNQVGVEVLPELAYNLPVKPTEKLKQQRSITELECQVCFEVVTEEITVPCGHVVCKLCWEEYLKEKINTGNVSKLKCPAYDCSELMPMSIIKTLIPEEIYQKYQKFGLDKFVTGKTDIKWCPHPGCERAVQVLVNNPAENDDVQDAGTRSDSSSEKKIDSRNVDCGVGHFFCWSCSKTAHDPCTCEVWEEWEKEVAERIGDKQGAQRAAEKASDDVWVGENCKPCPSCKSPIYKDDGCNHMTCYNCNHEFCWMCMGRWLFHGSLTGGYFECNKFIMKKLANRKLESAKIKAKKKAKKKHGRYFKHVYDRYKNHIQSLEYELTVLEKAGDRMSKLKALASSEQDVAFFEDAIRELLKCRHVLKASYALSYYLHTEGERDGFIKLIAEVEKSTELLAQSIAKPHLQTPKDQIILLTVESREQRRSFLLAARKFNPSLLAIQQPAEPEIIAMPPQLIQRQVPLRRQVPLELIQLQVPLELIQRQVPLHGYNSDDGSYDSDEYDLDDYYRRHSPPSSTPDDDDEDDDSEYS
ncbi:ankyrin repeat and IBR domain-containing protein 1-like [Dysidea avara]|uniref:ankyrin repeat and IBR domain-containing protein 1-like n=1 Tax=Dysidea avara TaxID=196820 RepID=UPI0033294F73